MSARLERFRAAGEAGADGTWTRRGALRVLMGVVAVAAAGGVAFRPPVGEEVTARAGSCTRRSLTGPDDCPGGRVPKEDYTPLVNGCGPQDSVDLVPDIPGGFPFVGACAEHDVCYGTCGSDRATCDRNFHDRMLQVCESVLIPSDSVVSCYALAYLYFKAVDLGGADPFAQGQVEGCDCCEEDEDAEPPPPPPPLCAECSCGGTFADYGECLAECKAGLGCFVGICHPVECP